jgi:hypothetical protein
MPLYSFCIMFVEEIDDGATRIALHFQESIFGFIFCEGDRLYT